MADLYWYIIEDIDRLDTPALVMYPDRVKQNIDMLKYMIDDVFRLRPHVKTHKNKQVTQLQLDAGITKFKCATIAEAEMLGMKLAPDVLLAYQPVGPKIDRLIQLIVAYPVTRFSCLVDNRTSAIAISASAQKNNLSLDVFIDLNVGMNRSGIAPCDEALQLYVDCALLPGINPIGLHAYDGHIHDADLQTRIEKANRSYEPVSLLQQKLKELGHAEPVIIAGGSPTFAVYAKMPLIECSAGTFVYWDRGYQLAFPEEPFLPALLVVARVISLPTTSTICLDCGHKSMAAENILSKRVYFINAPELIMISQSEEHLVADAGAGHAYKIGDVFYGLPYHVCPTVAVYESAVTVEHNHITGEWQNIARDRKITI